MKILLLAILVYAFVGSTDLRAQEGFNLVIIGQPKVDEMYGNEFLDLPWSQEQNFHVLLTTRSKTPVPIYDPNCSEGDSLLFFRLKNVDTGTVYSVKRRSKAYSRNVIRVAGLSAMFPIIFDINIYDRSWEMDKVSQKELKSNNWEIQAVYQELKPIENKSIGHSSIIYTRDKMPVVESSWMKTNFSNQAKFLMSKDNSDPALDIK